MLRKTKLFASLLLLSLASCVPQKTNSEAKSNYKDYQIAVEQQIAWADVLSQEDNNYLVFFYSETCKHCHDIIEEVISFAESKIMSFYFVDTQNNKDVHTNNAIDQTIGKDNMDDVFIMGTPSIIEVEEAAVFANVAGKEAILNFLNEKRSSN